MKFGLFLSSLFMSQFVYSMPNCLDYTAFKTSTYGMLQTSLRSVDIDSPERDAKINFRNRDYRFLGVGDFGGIKILGADSLEQKELCKYGIRLFPGLTDSHESPAHSVLANKVRNYSIKYNTSLINLLGIEETKK